MITVILTISISVGGYWQISRMVPYETVKDCHNTLELVTDLSWWPKEKLKIACMDANKENDVIESMEIGGE